MIIYIVKGLKGEPIVSFEKPERAYNLRDSLIHAGFIGVTVDAVPPEVFKALQTLSNWKGIQTMTLRKLQDGDRGTIVIYHLTGQLDAKVKAVSEGFTVYNETFEAFKHHYDNPSDVSNLPRPLYLVGFSEGCQGVRAQLNRGVNPAGIVLADGVHSSIPVDFPRQLAKFQQYAFAAIAKEVVMSVSRTSIETSGYNSTTDTLPLFVPMGDVSEIGKTSDGGTILKGGNLTVYLYPGKDAAAHVAQAVNVLPRMISDITGKSSTSVGPPSQVEPKAPNAKPPVTPKPPGSDEAVEYAAQSLLFTFVIAIVGFVGGLFKRHT